MRVPKRVKIVANNETAYYDKFIGQEYDVLYTFGSEVILPIISEDEDDYMTSWHKDEYEVLEWEEIEE